MRLFFLFDLSRKKDDGYIYERDFLGIADYGKVKAEIFKPVTDKIGVGCSEIYNVKHRYIMIEFWLRPNIILRIAFGVYSLLCYLMDTIWIAMIFLISFLLLFI